MDLDAAANIFALIPADWMILGAFAIFVAFDCLRSGARRITTLALAFPAALFVFTNIQSTVFLGDIARQFATPLLETVLFFILLIGIYVLISRMGLSWGGEAGQTIQAALAGVAGVAIVAVFWVQVPALDSLWHFGPQVQEIFGPGYRALWLIGSYAALAFVRST